MMETNDFIYLLMQENAFRSLKRRYRSGLFQWNGLERNIFFFIKCIFLNVTFNSIRRVDREYRRDTLVKLFSEASLSLLLSCKFDESGPRLSRSRKCHYSAKSSGQIRKRRVTFSIFITIVSHTFFRLSPVFPRVVSSLTSKS